MASKPGQPTPHLSIDTLDDEGWSLRAAGPKSFTLIVFYRGLHCPICAGYLGELNGKLEAFRERGVEVVAVSCDSRGSAEESRQEWGLNELTVGYDLSVAKAREWGLFISRAIKEGETPEFCEPGLFLVRPDGTLYFSAVNTSPFARPHFDDVLAGLDFILQHEYPPRGTD